MADEIANNKYLNRFKPQYIFTNKGNDINFCIDFLIQTDLTANQKIDTYKSIIKRYNTSNSFLDSGTILNENVEIGYLDYFSQALDSDMYILNAFFNLDKYEVFFAFNCQKDTWIKWKPILTNMLKSISLYNIN